MSNIKENVANNLRHYRRLRGLTQRQLANDLGVEHNTISSWENGPNSIDISYLFTICDLLKVSLDEMYGREKITVPSWNCRRERFKSFLYLENYQTRNN